MYPVNLKKKFNLYSKEAVHIELLTLYAYTRFKFDWVLMSIVILCIMTAVLYELLNMIEQLYLKNNVYYKYKKEKSVKRFLPNNTSLTYSKNFD